MTDTDRLKRLLWRAGRRGFKEADLVLGGFAEAHLSEMNAGELDEFERLLEIPDQELFPVLIGRQPTPPDWDGPVMRRIQTLAHFKDTLWAGKTDGS